MKVAIIGANGQLGTDLIKTFGDDAIPLYHKDIETSDYESCYNCIEEIKPDVVINTAAFHNVDACQTNQELATKINTLGAKNVAIACSKIKAISCYISTDFVFDGTKGKYNENDRTNPINFYGQSKMQGEIMNIVADPYYYIFRVSSLFGAAGSSGKGDNFIEKIIKKNNEEISMVNNIFMSPTYTKNASEIINQIIKKKSPFDTYHINNYGRVSWYDFSKKICEKLDLKIKIKGVNSNNNLVRRPLDSSMVSINLKRIGIKQKSWEMGLDEYLIERGYINA